MRLLYLSADPGVPVLGHKGASIHVRELATAFAACGVSVVVASPRTCFEGDRLDADVELVEIDPVLPKQHASSRSLRRAMRDQAAQVVAVARERGVDAIYERYSLFSDAGVTAAAELEIPHALEMNAPLRDEARRFRTLPHAAEAEEIEAGLLAVTDRVFAVSAELRDALVADGLDAAKAHVLPNAVNPAKFPRRQKRDRGAFIVGFCGSLKPWHGIDVLVAAFRAAAAHDERLRLEIVGTGPMQEFLAEAAASDDRILRHGPLPHGTTIETMARWHVGVAPFHPMRDFYFSPLKVLEYMAAGCCVVASDLGQIRLLLGNGDRGVLVEAGDIDALAASLLQLARDPGLATELAARGRHSVLSRHTWARNARSVLDALASTRVELVA
jgi:glycosyltransferase involved in cell wall biosynthesis